MKLAERQLSSDVAQATAGALGILWALSLLGQLHYLLNRSPGLVELEPFFSFLLGSVGVLPIVLPLAALAGLCISLARFQESRNEIVYLTHGSSTFRQRVFLLFPALLLTLCSLLLQGWVMPKVHSYIKSPTHLNEAQFLTKLATLPPDPRLPFFIHGNKADATSLDDLRFLRIGGGKLVLALTSQNASFYYSQNPKKLWAKLGPGQALKPLSENMTAVLSFSSANYPMPFSLSDSSSAKNPRAKSLHQIFTNKRLLNRKDERLLSSYCWEPWRRLLMGVAPLLLCLQALLSFRLAVPPKNSISNALSIFVVLTLFGFGLTIATKNVAASSIWLPGSYATASLFLPLILCRIFCGRANS